MHLSVIVPAFNEARNVRRTLEDISGYLSSRAIDHEILVVINGSIDGTEAVARSMAGTLPTLKVIELEERGKGLAVRTGMLAAKGEIRLLTDADGSTSIEQVETLMRQIPDGYDVVIGSIAVEGAQIASGSEPMWRRLFGTLGNLFIQCVAVPGIHDTQRGFKVFSARAADEIFPRVTIRGWGFDVEALALARRLGFRIKEVPVRWQNDPRSHVGLGAYPEVLRDTLRVRWRLWTGAYGPSRPLESTQSTPAATV